MSDFLLLHGLCVGSWEWERLIPVLRADSRTRTIVAPDMPGRGANRPGRYAEIPLTEYLATAVAALRSHNLRDVILVGHSAAGAYLQAVAAAEPERVRRIVFLCAAVPERGRSLLGLQPLPVRLFSRLLLWLTRAKQRGIRPSHRLAARALCHDLRRGECEPLLVRLVPEPPALLTNPITWDAARVRAPATYILTDLDRVIRPSVQRRMIQNLPNAEVVHLPMGHARPVVEPAALAELLLGYAEP